ncbi:MAG: hypothetical protein ACTHQQ_19815 [Solirubrobacteraceae bacterium]
MTATFLVPAIAAALLLCAEALTGPRRDLAWLSGVAIAAVVICVVVELAATVAVGRSVGLTVAGTAAAVAAIGLLHVLLRLVLGR